MDRKDLKIQALLQKITQLEDAHADARVEITVLSQQVEELGQRLKEANEVSSEAIQAPADDTD